MTIDIKDPADQLKDQAPELYEIILDRGRKQVIKLGDAPDGILGKVREARNVAVKAQMFQKCAELRDIERDLLAAIETAEKRYHTYTTSMADLT